MSVRWSGPEPLRAAVYESPWAALPCWWCEGKTNLFIVLRNGVYDVIDRHEGTALHHLVAAIPTLESAQLTLLMILSTRGVNPRR